MKKIFSIILMMMMIPALFAQQTWTKGSGNISLYSASDKVGIGTTGTTDKLTIKSLSGETPLNLVGYGTYTNPFLKLSSSNNTALFKLFAKSDWWLIGSSFDSTTAIMSVRPAKGWIRFNATAQFNRIKSNVISITPDYNRETWSVGDLTFNVGDSTLYLAKSLEVLTPIATENYVHNYIADNPPASDTDLISQIVHDTVVLYKRPYKVYTAIMHQSGDNAPTATILENSIGNLVWSRLNEGMFKVSLNNAFPEAKTFIVTQLAAAPMPAEQCKPYYDPLNGDDALQFNCISYDIDDSSLSSTTSDDIFDGCFIEIRVYP